MYSQVILVAQLLSTNKAGSIELRMTCGSSTRAGGRICTLTAIRTVIACVVAATVVASHCLRKVQSLN